MPGDEAISNPALSVVINSKVLYIVRENVMSLYSKLHLKLSDYTCTQPTFNYLSLKPLSSRFFKHSLLYFLNMN